MKKISLNKFVLIAGVAAAGVLFSCTNTKKEQQENAYPYNDTVVTSVTEQTTPQTYVYRQDFTRYTYADRNQAMQAARAEVDSLNNDIDKLKADLNRRGNTMTAEAKAEYERSIKELEKQRDEFKTHVDKFNNTTEDNWEKFKQDVNTTYRKVADGIERGWNNLKDNVNDAVNNNNNTNTNVNQNNPNRNP